MELQEDQQDAAALTNEVGTVQRDMTPDEKPTPAGDLKARTDYGIGSIGKGGTGNTKTTMPVEAKNMLMETTGITTTGTMTILGQTFHFAMMMPQSK